MSAGSLLRQQMDGALPNGAEWDEREAALLSLAEAQADDIDALEKELEHQGPMVIGSTGQQRLNPIFGELRQQRLALSRILSDLRMPEEGMGKPKNTVKQRAANARWDRERKRLEAV